MEMKGKGEGKETKRGEGKWRGKRNERKGKGEESEGGGKGKERGGRETH